MVETKSRDNNAWYRYNDSDTVLVFVHGVLSDSASCWLNNKVKPNVFWPDLIESDDRFKGIAIYLAGYHTAVDSGDFPIHQCAQQVFSYLKTSDTKGRLPVLSKQKIIFVCHSMGGIVVRQLLCDEFKNFAGKKLGIVLIASPSYGSKVADTLPFVLELYNHKQGKQLRWANDTVKELDRRFRNLIDETDSLAGREMFESLFPFKFLRKWLPWNKHVRIVSEESAARYFAKPEQIPGADHSSICKPRDAEDPVHQYLLAFLEEKNLLPAPPNALQNPGDKPRPAVSAKPNNLGFISIGDLFKGRDDTLRELYEKLQTKRPLVIHGLGGVGKTRLTVEYALAREGDYAALLSVGAGSPEALASNLAALCAVLALPEQQAKERDVQIHAVLRWLNDNPGWLLLLDNADTGAAAGAVQDLLPRLRAGHVIVTSRLSHWGKAVATLELQQLSPAAAVEFLLEATDGKRISSATDQADAAGLAEDLGYLALALEQAAAHIETRRISLAAYRERWGEREAKVRTWYDPNTMAYGKSVAVAWDTSFEQLGAAARALLRLLCWLAAAPIPRSLLETESAADTLGKLANPSVSAAEEAMAELARYSLLQWDAGAASFRIHRLVQEVTQDQIPSEQRKDSVQAALDTVDAALPGDPPPDDVRSWPVWEPLADHVAAILRFADENKITEPTARLMNQLGVLLRQKCVWKQAETLYGRALAIDEASYGAEHPRVATQLNNLAQLLQATNRLAEAEPLMRRAVDIILRFFVATGHHYPDEATSITNYRALLGAMNRTPEQIEARLNEIAAVSGVTLDKP